VSIRHIESLARKLGQVSLSFPEVSPVAYLCSWEGTYRIPCCIPWWLFRLTVH